MKPRRRSRESVSHKGKRKARPQTVRRLRVTIKKREAQISRLLAELREARALLMRM
jgi:hypothetical protein